MPKKEQSAQSDVKRIRSDKRTHFMTPNRYGDVGKTTELLRLLNALHYAGKQPALISADPTSKVLYNIYASRDGQTGQVESNQVLGKGVVEVDIEAKQGQLADYLFKHDGDTLTDFKGGVFDAFISEYNGIEPFFNEFEDDRFIFLTPISNIEKAFDHLEHEFNQIALADTSAEVHLVHILSLGKIGNQQKLAAVNAKYEEFMRTHNYNDLTMKSHDNVVVHKVIFRTSWQTKDAEIFFSSNKIREAALTEQSNNRILARQFLNEGDKFWINTLFTPEDVQQLAELPKWDKPSEKWGKIIA